MKILLLLAGVIAICSSASITGQSSDPKCVDPNKCPLPPICATVLCAVPTCAPGVKTAVPPGQCCPKCVCKDGDETYFPGDTYKVDCNTCTCTDNGLIACTRIACTDPCTGFECPTGSQCKVYEPTGEPFCEPSCDLDNGGCADDEVCSLEDVVCVRSPCPPQVKCTPNKNPCIGFECPTGSQCKVYEPTGEPFCEPSCDLDNGGCADYEVCSLEDVVCVRSPCPPQVKCKCPPTCSREFCSDPRNKNKPCSRPPPFTVPPCPNACRTTFCKACYYSDTALPTPSNCVSDKCKEFPPSNRCLYEWACCVGSQTVSTVDGAFRCYEYPCPLKG